MSSRCIYCGRPFTRHEMQKAIVSPQGWRVGWELDLVAGKSDWLWARIVYDTQGKVQYCEAMRECSEDEKQHLNDLLRGEIVCRYVAVAHGYKPWAFAIID